MKTTINSGHPLMNTNDERLRIRAVLKHLGSGADLAEFPATPSEKVALVKTASQRKLIAWHKNRSRYELTQAGWCELAPRRRFGVGSMLAGSAAGAAVGAVALAVFWVAAGTSHPVVPRLSAARPAVAEKVASLSAPAVDGALASPASPAASDPVQTAMPAAPIPPTPAHEAEPVREAAPAAPVPAAEPTNVAEQRSAEQLAEQTAKAKRAAAKKARQRAVAARRRREEEARTWAATEPSGTRQAEYSGVRGYGGGYGGYGGQGSWFAYR